MPIRGGAGSDPVPGRRKVLAALAGGVTIGVAGCQLPTPHSSVIEFSRETTIEAVDEGWRIDGAVESRFGDNAPDELRDVRVVAVDEYGESLADVEIGDISNPDPDEPGVSVREPIDLSVSQFPFRVAIDMPSPCDSEGVEFTIRYHEYKHFDSGQESSLHDVEWRRGGYSCYGVDELGDPTAVRINSSRSAEDENRTNESAKQEHR